MCLEALLSASPGLYVVLLKKSVNITLLISLFHKTYTVHVPQLCIACSMQLWIHTNKFNAFYRKPSFRFIYISIFEHVVSHNSPQMHFPSLFFDCLWLILQGSAHSLLLSETARSCVLIDLKPLGLGSRLLSSPLKPFCPLSKSCSLHKNRQECGDTTC